MSLIRTGQSKLISLGFETLSLFFLGVKMATGRLYVARGGLLIAFRVSPASSAGPAWAILMLDQYGVFGHSEWAGQKES